MELKMDYKELREKIEGQLSLIVGLQEREKDENQQAYYVGQAIAFRVALSLLEKSC